VGLLKSDSGVGHYFLVELDGIAITEVMEVSGLSIEQDVVELKQNTPDGKYSVKKMPGRQKAGSFTVTRPLNGSNALQQWLQSSLKGDMKSARKTCAVSITDFTGAPIQRWKFDQAWCSKVETSQYKAGDTSALTEKATVNYEMVEVTDFKPPA
jgi:phage tail-like protein